MLSKHDKRSSMSDTILAQELMRDAFPTRKYGSVKAAVYEAYRFMRPKVLKEFTLRRARSIWEGAARRIDSEETAALSQAIIEEARREQQELRNRLERLDIALATADPSLPSQTLAAIRYQASKGRGVDNAGSSGR